MTPFMIAITDIGSPYIMFVLTALISIVLLYHKKYHHFLQFIVFMIFGALSVYFLKITFQIPRPIESLIEEYGYGFPSGHTTMATLFFLLIMYAYQSHIKKFVLRWIYVIGCLFFIAVISYSRIYLGVHSWVDVTGGYFLGIIWFVLSIIFYNTLKKRSLIRSFRQPSTNKTSR